MGYLVLLALLVVAAAGPSQSPEDVLKELLSIQSSLWKQENSLRFVGAIAFDATEVILKQPLDKILIKRLETKFHPYFDKVLSIREGDREATVIAWISGQKSSNETLLASQTHLKESQARLEEYVKRIREVKGQMERETTVIKTDDDRRYVLLKNLVSFEAVLPILQSSLHALDWSVLKFQEFVQTL